MTERVAFEFLVRGEAIPKPRQTQRDRWARRPCVLRYRAWADQLRAAAMVAGGVPRDASEIEAEVWLPMPASWSAKKREAASGEPHRVKPDASNLLKAIEDALIPDDQKLYRATVTKRWDDGSGPRARVRLLALFLGASNSASYASASTWHGRFRPILVGYHKKTPDRGSRRLPFGRRPCQQAGGKWAAPPFW